MEYNIDNAELTATLTAVNLDTAVIGQAPLEVAIGESAQIDVGTAINYIESGKAEIMAAVQEGTAAFDLNAEQKNADFNANASNKTTVFDNNAATKTQAYNDNTTIQTAAYNQNASDKTAAFNTNAENQFDDYNANASNKLNAYNDNASDKLMAFDNNAATKTQAYNDNATAKTTAFNDNAAIKQAAVDASADAAAVSATTAKQYAIGVPSEPSGYSAKYWSEQAAQSLSGLQSDVAGIKAVIPTSATASNKLTDKSYVDTADNNLQSQIDAITASSDVTDIVGTSAELQSYDTSTLPPNSIIKVLQDESRNNETTYYRWVITGGVGAWSLIGEEGPYYTISAADAKFATQTALSDYVTINTAQTISAAKTFTAQPQFAVGQGVRFNTSLTGEYYVMRSTGNPSAGCSLLLNNNTSTTAFNVSTDKITIGSGTILPNSVTPATSDDSTRIATTAYVKAQGYITGITSNDVTTALGYTPYNASNPSGYITSAALENYVTTDTEQTITGNKVFLGNLDKQNSLAVKGETGTGRFWIISCCDKNGTNNTNRLSLWQTAITTSGNTETSLLAYKNEAATNTYNGIKIIYPLSGNPYATAPASDVNGSILTTVNKSKAANGYLQLGNGVIINWGRATVQTSSSSTTVTFSKAYSNNNAAQVTVQAGGAAMPKVTSINSTSFVLSRDGSVTPGSALAYSWMAIGY